MYVIHGSYLSDDKSFESVEFCLLETDVWFKLPNPCLRKISRAVVLNGFIFILKTNGDMERLEA